MTREGLGGASLGYRTIIDALEDSDADLEVEIPGVEQWLRIIGEYMYRGEYNHEFYVLPQMRRLWGEGRKMTIERWNFWKQRLREICEMAAGIKDETRESAKRCLKGMEVIEISVQASHIEDISNSWVHISPNDLDSTV